MNNQLKLFNISPEYDFCKMEEMPLSESSKFFGVNHVEFVKFFESLGVLKKVDKRYLPNMKDYKSSFKIEETEYKNPKGFIFKYKKVIVTKEGMWRIYKSLIKWNKI